MISPAKKNNHLPPFLKWMGQSPAKSKAPSLRLACDFGKSKIVILEIEKSGESLFLNRVEKIVRSGTNEKDIELLKGLREKCAFKTSKIRISVKGQGVIIRFVQFPKMKLSELRSAVSFEIDQYIPFKAHEVVWDVNILDENAAGASGALMNVLLVAVKKDDLMQNIEIFQLAGFQIEFIDVDSLATFNAFEFFHPEEMASTSAIIDIGSEVSTLSVVQNAKPRFIRDISFGGVDILKRLRRKLGLTNEQAVQQIEVDRVPTPEATAVIKDSLAELVSDLRVSMNYYLDQVSGAEPVKKLFLGGGGGYDPLVVETLQGHFGFPVQTMNLLSRLKLGKGIEPEFIQKNASIFPVPVGLGLRDS